MIPFLLLIFIYSIFIYRPFLAKIAGKLVCGGETGARFLLMDTIIEIDDIPLREGDFKWVM